MVTQLKNLMSKLMKLHRRFLELERQAAEKQLARAINPFDFLHLLTQAPTFAWLRPFSTLLADLDAVLDEADLGGKSTETLQSEIKQVLALPQIHQRYELHLHSDPEFAVAASEFTAALTALTSKK